MSDLASTADTYRSSIWFHSRICIIDTESALDADVHLNFIFILMLRNFIVSLKILFFNFTCKRKKSSLQFYDLDFLSFLIQIKDL